MDSLKVQAVIKANTKSGFPQHGQTGYRTCRVPSDESEVGGFHRSSRSISATTLIPSIRKHCRDNQSERIKESCDVPEYEAVMVIALV